MESYYDCIIEDIIWKNFNHWNSIDYNCTKKCLPRYLIHNSTLQCEFDDDMKCALDVMYWRYVDHSNCPRPCSIVRYYGKVDFWQPWNSSDSSFSIDFKYAPPTKEKVYQEYHNTSTRLIGAATAKDAWLILFWFLRQFFVIKRQIAAESTFFNFFSSIWKPSQAFYALAATVALCDTLN